MQGNKTKFKRLKKAGKQGVVDDRRARGGLSDDEEEEEEGGRRGRTAEEELKRSLFGDDEGEFCVYSRLGVTMDRFVVACNNASS